MRQIALKLTGALVLMATPSLYAQTSSKCAAPPYGSTASAFKQFTQRWQSTDATSLVSILKNTCRAKYQHGDRRPLYTVGLTDEEIASQDTVTLADTWMDITVRSITRPAPPDEGTHIYALFFCMNASMCQLHGGVSSGPFRSLSDCQRQASLNSSGIPPGPDGRIHLGSYWWECRQRRVDTWEPAP